MLKRGGRHLRVGNVNQPDGSDTRVGERRLSLLEAVLLAVGSVALGAAIALGYLLLAANFCGACS